ncbi:hypothetical protein DPMN_155727 [Dreissena polymorpha]|uniref:Uncharacterized protein n=1 Tax=Dreissena polymorpha TaxID=45954 RepID=A0A9D4FMR0_DREPO|nr:hypothetical protein DPMN_155727 [Dreissena polymorpha]
MDMVLSSLEVVPRLTAQLMMFYKTCPRPITVEFITGLCLCYREKKLLVGSEDYGKDLTGVQNLRKKHRRLEAELASHEPATQV